jgi:hypothetical protein
MSYVLSGQNEAYFQGFTDKDRSTFVETRSYRKLKSVLLEKHLVTISGLPGDGKTNMAVHLMLELSTAGGPLPQYKLVKVNSPNEWKKLVNPHTHTAVFMDDIFGAITFNDGDAQKWILFFEEMQKQVECSNGRLLVIMTSRAYVLNAARYKMHKFATTLFDPDHVIELSDDDVKLTLDEKGAILTKHMKYHGRELSRVVIDATAHGYPHCVELFTSNMSRYLRNMAISRIVF